MRAHLVGFCAALTGCTTAYSPPCISYLPSEVESFEGLKQQIAPAEPLTVIYVHGMCDHDTKWAEGISKSMEIGIGATSVRHQTQTVAGLRVYRSEFESPRGRLTAIFPIWSDVSNAPKQDLLFDYTQARHPLGTYPFRRALINDRLKAKLLNECLADALVYLGSTGEKIRAAMQEVICESLNGDYSIYDGLCILGAMDRRVALISESLGSKVLLDAYAGLANSAADHSHSQLIALSQSVKSIRYVYFLANQLPLLRLASQTYPSKSRMELDVESFLVLRRLPTDRFKESPPPLTIVSFSDPNDLLSYSLRPKDVGATSESIVNITVSNTPSIFGLFADPLAAHTHYDKNRDVLEYLWNGFRGQTARACP